MKPIILLTILLCCTGASAENADTAPRKHIGVYVAPYYQAAETPEGRPVVEVNKEFDALLASSKQADIVAVRAGFQSDDTRHRFGRLPQADGLCPQLREAWRQEVIDVVQGNT